LKVKTNNKLKPFILNPGASMNEKLIGLHEFLCNSGKRISKFLFPNFKSFLLLPDKLSEQVKFLLNISQGSGRNLAHLTVHFHDVILEFLDIEEYVLTFLSAGIDEVICL